MLETVGPPAPPTFELNTNGRILKGMRGTFFLGHRLPVASLSRQVARQPNESHRRIRREKKCDVVCNYGLPSRPVFTLRDVCVWFTLGKKLVWYLV